MWNIYLIIKTQSFQSPSHINLLECLVELDSILIFQVLLADVVISKAQI